MLRYAITDRTLHPGTESERVAALIAQAARWAANGIDFIQLREKDLSPAELASLSRSVLSAIEGSATRLLINHRADVALATGAHGVHLTSAPSELMAQKIRDLWAAATGVLPSVLAPIVTISCHTLEDVACAVSSGVDAILFAPVFEKPLPQRVSLPGSGLALLREAALEAHPTPVYALGGVTLENAHQCLVAGARGIAGIRLFQSV